MFLLFNKVDQNILSFLQLLHLPLPKGEENAAEGSNFASRL